MRYLSIDIEATGLAEDDLIIEFAAIPFCTKMKTIEEGMGLSFYVKCPSFKELKPKLCQWVIDHNQDLISKASQVGVTQEEFKAKLSAYLQSHNIKSYFKNEKITLLGKSLNAIDLPFLNRDLGWDFMREHFNHRQQDVSSVAYSMIDMGLLPENCESGSELMKYLGMGSVCHTALEDARNTALMYLKLLKKCAN